MYKVFLAGGIASGKSTVARILEELGASRIDLDQVSRSVLSPRSACSAAVAKAFGEDLVNPATGEIDRTLLARRAFATPESGAHLESIELPFISDELACTLAREESSGDAPVCVVEVPLLDRVESMLSQVDEVRRLACVACGHRGVVWTWRTSTDALPCSPPTSTCVRTQTLYSITLETRRTWPRRFVPGGIRASGMAGCGPRRVRVEPPDERSFLESKG